MPSQGSRTFVARGDRVLLGRRFDGVAAVPLGPLVLDLPIASRAVLRGASMVFEIHGPDDSTCYSESAAGIFDADAVPASAAQVIQ